jgi:hypothetical protein
VSTPEPARVPALVGDASTVAVAPAPLTPERQPAGAPRRAKKPHGARLWRELATVTALYAVLLAAAFPTIVSGQRSIAPNGALAGQLARATQATYPYPVTAPRTADAGAFAWFFAPMAVVTHRTLTAGQLPVWNDLSGLGIPLAADVQTAPYSPFYVALDLRPTAGVWEIVILARILIGAVGCYLLLRVLGASRPASMLLGGVYLLAPMFVAWAPQVSMNAETLVPWMLAAIVAVSRRPTALRGVGLALVAAAIALAGQPEVAIVVGCLGAGWAVYWWVGTGRRRAVLVEYTLAAVAAALLSAVQTIPAVEYFAVATSSHGNLLGLTRVPLTTLIAGVGPDPPLLGGTLLAFAAGGVCARRSWPAGTPLLLAVAAVWLVRSPDWVGSRMLNAVPVLASVNVPRYGEVLIALAAAMLGVAAVDEARQGNRRPAALALTAAAACALIGVVNDASASEMQLAVLSAVMTAGLLYGVARRPSMTALLLIVPVVQCLVLVPPFSLAHPANVLRPVEYAQFLQQQIRAGDRFAALGRLMRPQYGAALGLPDVRVEDALYPERFARLMAVRQLAGPQRFALTPNLRLLTLASTAAQASGDLIDALAVRFVAAPKDQAPPPGFRVVFARSGGPSVWENDNAYPLAFSPRMVAAATGEAAAAALLARIGRLRDMSVIEQPTVAMRRAHGTAAASIVTRTSTRLVLAVHASGDAVLIVSDELFPGWVARVDGHPTTIRPANLAMRAIAVPAGTHRVEFVYQPWSLAIGTALSIAGVALLVGRVAIAGWRARRRRRPVAVAASKHIVAP